MARFVRELFPSANLGGEFKGSITASTSSPVAVVVLRTVLNAAGEFLITTQTVGDLDAAAHAPPLYVPQIVAGGGYTTEVLLVNGSSAALTGTLDFRSPAGEPQNMGIPQASGGTVAYQLGPNGSHVFRTEAAPSAPVQSGYLIVRPATGQAAPITGAVFTYSQNSTVVAATGVSPAPVSTRVRFFADRRTGYDTGVAFVNPGTGPATVRFTAASAAGHVEPCSRGRSMGGSKARCSCPS